MAEAPRVEETPGGIVSMTQLVKKPGRPYKDEGGITTEASIVTRPSCVESAVALPHDDDLRRPNRGLSGLDSSGARPHEVDTARKRPSFLELDYGLPSGKDAIGDDGCLASGNGVRDDANLARLGERQVECGNAAGRAPGGERGPRQDLKKMMMIVSAGAFA